MKIECACLSQVSETLSLKVWLVEERLAVAKPPLNPAAL